MRSAVSQAGHDQRSKSIGLAGRRCSVGPLGYSLLNGGDSFLQMLEAGLPPRVESGNPSIDGHEEEDHAPAQCDGEGPIE
jgi:hypothetical protein